MQARTFLALLAIALLLGGCATATHIDVRYAPEIKLNGVRSVKVERFRVGSCERSSGGYSLKEILFEVFVEEPFNALIDALSDAAFGEYDRYSVYDRYRVSLHETLTEAFVRNGSYRLTASQDYDARIGGAVGCRLRSQSSETVTTDKDGKKSISYNLSLDADVRVRFVVQGKTGETLGTGEVTASEQDISTGRSSAELSASARDEDRLVEAALKKSAELLVQKVAPYVVRERRAFATSESTAIADGIEAAKRGNWEQAVVLWEKASQSADLSERVAGIHNLAIYDEVRGDFRRAEERYEQLHSIARERKYRREAERLRKRIEDEAWWRSEYGGEKR